MFTIETMELQNYKIPPKKINHKFLKTKPNWQLQPLIC